MPTTTLTSMKPSDRVCGGTDISNTGYTVTAAIPTKCSETIARIIASVPPYLQNRVIGRAMRLAATAPKPAASSTDSATSEGFQPRTPGISNALMPV